MEEPQKYIICPYLNFLEMSTIEFINGSKAFNHYDLLDVRVSTIQLFKKKFFCQSNVKQAGFCRGEIG